MTHTTHPAESGGRRASALPACCQAWAAEQARPWTRRPAGPDPRLTPLATDGATRGHPSTDRDDGFRERHRPAGPRGGAGAA